MTDIEFNLSGSPTKRRGGFKKKRNTVNSQLDILQESNEDIAKQYKKFTNAPKFNLNSEEVYCICREPDEGDIMVACDGCEEWFHMKCMNVNPDVSNLISKFYCKFCNWKGIGVTLWKRKCRLDGCLEPIMDNSKYCSKEHGEEYMKRLFYETNIDTGIIKKVLNYVDNGEKLHQLGSEFPELEEVKAFKSNGNMNQFPKDTQDELTMLENKIKITNERIQNQETKLQTLQKLKESTKSINEKLSEIIYPEENQKKKKHKKIELCMCDKSENNMVIRIGSSDDLMEKLSNKLQKIRENDEKEEDEGEDENEDEDAMETDDLQDEDIEDPDWFHNVCIKEKKKCHRHSGWFNLYYDEVIKALDQLLVKKDQLQIEKNNVLRNYSVSIYENQ
ncbi:SPP1 [Candida pseudojiufengensis]|uniref:SPP1 n=1 Tax=Candida pseudojiufengensis TaxID=497109 RepID=UPI0022242148|nr:SPP1 [Candida pseudojiufengensis]KAI5966281.1 SPP1 [Candida pseudojiufengensis]